MENQPTNEQILEFYLAQAGLLGYPGCCAEAYHNVKDPKTAPEPQRSIYLKNGSFFPCEEHAMEIENGLDIINDLIIPRRDIRMPKFKLECDENDRIEIHNKSVEILKAEGPIKWSWLKFDKRQLR